MNKSKRNSKKNSKKNRGLNGGNIQSGEMIGDDGVQKVTVTMEALDGSTVTTTETKFPSGNVEIEVHESDPDKNHKHIHREKNDYFETNIDIIDDNEVKTVTRTSKNPDGTITKKTTVVITYPDGRIKTDHSEETIQPEEEASKPQEVEETSEIEFDKESSPSISKSDSSNKLSTIHEDEDKVTTEVLADREIKKIESIVENPDGSRIRKTEVITLYKDGFLNRKIHTEDLETPETMYPELPGILSALTDYLAVIKSDENLNNRNIINVPYETLRSGISYSSKNYEILNSGSADYVYIKPEVCYNSEIHDYGSELMSKHVHLLTYYGNINIFELKKSLLRYFSESEDKIIASESKLDACLKSIDYDSDGVLNYVEFVDFFCLFFSNKWTFRKNLMSVLNEHNINHSENGYLNRHEATNMFKFLSKFYGVDAEKEQFSDRISYEMFVEKVLPVIENNLYVK